jgi:hypothetical protein
MTWCWRRRGGGLQGWHINHATVHLSFDVQHHPPRDSKDELHPLNYAAGCLLSDGQMLTAWQKKGLEYGTTLDAVTQVRGVSGVGLGQGGMKEVLTIPFRGPQLAQAIESRPRGTTVEVIIQLDQFGIAHAPCAPGRAFLSEFGHGSATVYVHDR